MELSSISIAITSLGSALFSPGAIFTTGVNGAWYDPSDFSTMFQDAAGTTPVTAVDQPVGLMLDKSKGLVLGPELVTNGGFSNGATGWTVPASWSISNGKATQDSNINTGFLELPISMSAGKFYAVAFDIDSLTLSSGNFSIRFIVGGVSTVIQTYITAGKKSFIYSPTASVTDIRFAINAAGGTVTIDNISVRELPGNHAFNPSGNSANFPVLQQDGTGRYYLAFNGVNQWLQTNSIDFTYGDKMFVSAGVRKLSDAAAGVIAELSLNVNSNNGAFQFTFPDGANGKNASFYSKGTVVSGSNSGATLSAPVTNVISGLGNISAPSATIRVNGTQVAQSTFSQGTGNYGNYAMYFGSSAGSGLFFNGRLYGLVVAGKQASAGEIASTETWLNQKTGAY